MLSIAIARKWVAGGRAVVSLLCEELLLDSFIVSLHNIIRNAFHAKNFLLDTRTVL